MNFESVVNERMDYMWLDNQRKQVRLPAPQYTGKFLENRVD
jgi:hypothetical protein